MTEAETDEPEVTMGKLVQDFKVVVQDAETLLKADQLGLSPGDFLARHDAYHFFQATGDLLRTGLTETNVMDVQVILIGASSKPNE